MTSTRKPTTGEPGGPGAGGVGLRLGLTGLCATALTFACLWLGQWTPVSMLAAPLWFLSLFVLSPAAVLVGVPVTLWEARRGRVAPRAAALALALCLLNLAPWALSFWLASRPGRP